MLNIQYICADIRLQSRSQQQIETFPFTFGKFQSGGFIKVNFSYWHPASNQINFSVQLLKSLILPPVGSDYFFLMFASQPEVNKEYFHRQHFLPWELSTVLMRRTPSVTREEKRGQWIMIMSAQCVEIMLTGVYAQLLTQSSHLTLSSHHNIK